MNGAAKAAAAEVLINSRRFSPGCGWCFMARVLMAARPEVKPARGSCGQVFACKAAASRKFGGMSDWTNSRWLPVILLTCSNVFMAFAWYGHLRHKQAPLWLAIFVSWGIALFEYLLMVPANRWGNSVYSATELKIMQEVITLSVFSGFAVAYLGERIRWNHAAAFLCVIAAVVFTFLPRG